MSKEPEVDETEAGEAEEERSADAASPDKGRSGAADDDADDDDEYEDEDEDDDEDEDEDDDEDEDEDDDDDRPVSRRPAKAAAPRRPPVKQLSEKEINSPQPQTLFMLGVVAFMTLLMWGLARFACNAHPPQTIKPRAVTTQQLARAPKDAAVELQQRWATRRYAEALELATGSAAAELQKDQKACNADKNACDAESKKLVDQVMTTGALLSTSPAGATVRVTSTGGPKGKQSYVMQLTNTGTIWKVVSRTPGTGAPPAPGSAAPSPPAPGPAAP